MISSFDRYVNDMGFSINRISRWNIIKCIVIATGLSREEVLQDLELNFSKDYKKYLIHLGWFHYNLSIYKISFKSLYSRLNDRFSHFGPSDRCFLNNVIVNIKPYGGNIEHLVLDGKDIYAARDYTDNGNERVYDFYYWNWIEKDILLGDFRSLEDKE